MVRHFLIERKPGKPAPGKMHPKLFDQLALARYSVKVSDQQNSTETFWIDRRSPSIAVEGLQLLSHEIEVDVPIDQTEQVMLGYMIFGSKVIEERLRTALLTHHEGSPQSGTDKIIMRGVRARFKYKMGKQCGVFQQPLFKWTLAASVDQTA